MTEQKPEYKLEFVLTYDSGRSITFSGSSDDPLVAWRASMEILNLNNSMVSTRRYDDTLVSVNVYKDGKPLDKKDLVEEMRRYNESKRMQG